MRIAKKFAGAAQILAIALFIVNCGASETSPRTTRSKSVDPKPAVADATSESQGSQSVQKIDLEQQAPLPDTTPSELPDNNPNGVVLKVGTIFNQRNSQWCWAFSAFHTLRTYNENQAQHNNALARPWLEALGALDSQDAFWNFLSSRFPTMRIGMPQDFLNLMTQKDHLQNPGWRIYQISGGFPFGSGGDAQSLTRSEIMQRLQDGLRHHIPSTVCGAGHCRMVYGFTAQDGSVTGYHIADSRGSRKTYVVDPAQLEQTVQVVMTLAP